MEINKQVRIHNRFDIEVRDARTGEIRQRAQAENIILDALWSRLISSLSTYFNYINIGTGTGTLSASRTSLFTHTAALAAGSSAVGGSLADGYVSLRRSAQITEAQYVGSAFSEIGISYGSASTNLVTHATLKDMNGNATTITKTATDIITFYATVYVRFTGVSTPFISYMGGDLELLTMYPNGIMDIPGTTYTSPATATYILQWLMGIYALGSNNHTIVFSRDLSSGRPKYGESLVTSRDASIAATVTNTLATKTISFYARLPANSLNNAKYGVMSVELQPYNSEALGLGLRLCFPNSAYDGTAITGEAIGTGDGTETNFATDFPLVRAGAVIKVDGVAVTATVDTYKPLDSALRYILRQVTSDMGRYRSTKAGPLLGNVSMGLTMAAPGNTNGVIYENPYYATIDIKAIVSSANNKLYVSNDLSSWTEMTNTSGTYNIAAEYRGSRYWKFVMVSDETVNIDNINNTDYANYKNIHFAVAPAAGAVITADYTTDVVAKDANHVFDVTFTFTLGEYTP